MVTGPGGPGGPPPPHWPALPSGRPPSGWEKLWQALRVIRQRRLITGKRIGCAILVLLLIAVAALFAVSKIVNEISDVFTDDPEPVAGSPFDTVAPTTSPQSDSAAIDRTQGRDYVIVAIQESPGLADKNSETREWTGFDVEIVKLIARDLGLDPERTQWKEIPGGDRESAVNRKDADLIVGNFEITDARRAAVGIAGPYLASDIRLAVKAGSPVTSLEGVGDGKVCAVKGSQGEQIARAVIGDRLRTRNSVSGCRAVEGAAPEVVVGDERLLRTTLGEDFTIVGASLGTVGYGIGLAPDDDTFRNRVQDVLRRIETDGSWTRLYDQYLGAPAPPPPPLDP